MNEESDAFYRPKMVVLYEMKNGSPHYVHETNKDNFVTLAKLSGARMFTPEDAKKFKNHAIVKLHDMPVK